MIVTGGRRQSLCRLPPCVRRSRGDAGVVFEAVAVLGVFAVDLLTGQVVARMEKRERNRLAKAA